MSSKSLVRICDTNYIDTSILTFTDVSSEQAAFPVSNAYNLQRRSKVWRSNGYFKIEAGVNDTIIFNEGGGDLTATIVAGEYTSSSALATAIDTALTTAPGASGSYTVTHNSEYKFVITKSAGTFTIKWSHASTNAEDTLGFAAVDDTGALSYTADFVRIHSEEFILLDFGIETLPTAFFLIGPRNRAIRISPSATIKLQGNPTNNFSMPEYEQTLTYDDEVIALISDTGLHTQALRYWRIQIVDRDNPQGFVEVGAFFLGTFFDPNRGRVIFPFNSGFIDRSTTVFSEGGQTYSDSRNQAQQFSLTWKGLEKADIEEIYTIFNRLGTSKPFFVVFDAEQAFSTALSRMTKYVKWDSPPQWVLETPNNFSMQMIFREEL